MAEAKNETQLTARIVRAIEAEFPDCWVLKVHGGTYQRVGVPDLLVVVEGKLAGLEVKHPKPGEGPGSILSRVRPSQWVEIEKLHRAGAVAEVVWTVDYALEVVRGLTTPR